MKNYNDKIQEYVTAILNEDGDKLSSGSVRTLQIIRDTSRVMQYRITQLESIIVQKEIEHNERLANRQG